jgi:hypothetical protein
MPCVVAAGFKREGGGQVTVAQETEEMRLVAEKLETENPLWIVVFGVYTKEFVAFPRFHAPKGTMIRAWYPDAIEGRMRAVERATAPKGVEAIG